MTESKAKKPITIHFSTKNLNKKRETSENSTNEKSIVQEKFGENLTNDNNNQFGNNNCLVKKEDKTGYLLHLIQGSQNPVENFTFRQLCMRYGLQAWDEMNIYLPWRTRSDLRKTLIKMIKKQAIGEYSKIKADPAIISNDNINLEDQNYIFKNGVYINQKWDKSSKERYEIRNDNAERYGMETDESLKVDIVPIMNVDYLNQKMKKRKISLYLFRAAILAEQFRRKKEKKLESDNANLKLQDVVFLPSRKVRVKRSRSKLQWTLDASSHVFSVQPFKD